MFMQSFPYPLYTHTHSQTKSHFKSSSSTEYTLYLTHSFSPILAFIAHARAILWMKHTISPNRQHNHQHQHQHHHHHLKRHNHPMRHVHHYSSIRRTQAFICYCTYGPNASIAYGCVIQFCTVYPINNTSTNGCKGWSGMSGVRCRMDFISLRTWVENWIGGAATRRASERGNARVSVVRCVGRESWHQPWEQLRKE